MKKLILILLFTFSFTQEKDSLFYKDRLNFIFSAYGTNTSTFFGGSIQFIGNKSSENNFLFDVGCGIIARNESWNMEYFSFPSNFLYRRWLKDDFMFIETGFNSEGIIDSESIATMTFAPIFGMGVKFDKRIPFLKMLSFSIGYNLIDSSDSNKYYPAGLRSGYSLIF